MSGEQERRRRDVIAEGAAALAEFDALHQQATSELVEAVREQTGVTLPTSARPSVMDATRQQLEGAAARARSALAAMDVVLKVTWGDATTLGELIRDPFWTEQEREQIVEHLVRAGLS